MAYELPLLRSWEDPKIPIQIDIGFSDTITPNPITIDYPCYLQDLPAPALLGYPPATVIAEKVHAMIWMGETNSRLKDFYDIWLLSEHFDFDGSILQQAIRATFQKRQTDYPHEIPSCLTNEFVIKNKSEWARTIVSKYKLRQGPESDFQCMVQRLTEFLMPPIRALAINEPFILSWKAGSGWQDL